MSLQHILEVIPDNPKDRLPEELVKKFEESDPFIDVHTHLFTLNDVPSKFLGVRIPMNRYFIGNLVRLLKYFKKDKSRNSLSGYSYFLTTMKDRSSEAIYRRMNKVYYQDEHPDAVFGVLTMDMEVGIKGGTHNTIWTQFGIIAMVRNIYPDKILPFACIDPRRDDAMDLFKAAFNEHKPYKYYGLKVYPSLGYLPSHPILMQMLEVCEKKGIPVLSHCSGASTHGSLRKQTAKGTFVNYNGDEEIDKEFKARLFKKKKDYRDFYNRPHHWDPVLKQFPKLRLNIAHFGGDQAWDDYTKNQSGKERWVEKIIEQMEAYDHVYADFSYTLSYPAFANKLKQLITQNPIVADRILFGSDYYMLVIEDDYRNILSNFKQTMGKETMDKLSRTNNRTYLGL